MLSSKALKVCKDRRKDRQNPPPPPGIESKTVTRFYKPEINTIVRMISEERSAKRGISSITHLLDQFFLITPPASEDEGESVKEPGEIVSPAKVEMEDTEADRCMEVENNKMADLIAVEKKKKLIVQQTSPPENKKKREDKPDKKEKITKRCRYHRGTKNKTVSTQKKSRKPSPEDSHSNSSSPTLDKSSQRRSGISPSRSSKRPISSSVVRKRRKSPIRHRPTSRSPDLDSRRSGRKSPIRRRKSPTRFSPIQRSPTPRRRSPIRWSPARRSRRSPRRGSSIRRSPSSSPDLPRSYRQRSLSRQRSPSLSSRQRSPSLSSRQRSPSLSSRQSSPSVSSRHRSPPSVFSRLGIRPQSVASKRLSPVRFRVRAPPIRAPQKSLVPYMGRSGSSSQSSDEERLLSRLNKTQKTTATAPKPVIRRLVVPSGKIKNYGVQDQDEYSQILAEEMRKRQLVQDKDGVRVEKSAAVATTQVPVKNVPVGAGRSVPVPEDQGDKREFELQTSVKPETSVSQPQLVKAENIKSEFPDEKEGSLLNSYYCQACQLGLNSELTWQSHINGKKHAKMLKLQTVHEIAKGSIAIPSTPAVVSEDIPRFADAPPGKRRYFVNKLAKLWPAIEAVRDVMPGLDRIQEILSEMDINYYCELCDAPCGPSSIMPHLVGYKHHLRCLREIDPECYEKNKLKVKKSFESVLLQKLRLHERKYGRGQIKVVIEEDDPTTRPLYDYPGPSSWRNTAAIPYIKKKFKEDGETEIPINDECLDTSKGDFFCKLCDSHMNNVNMWEAHVRGKRHLKNAKKIPGENISKLKSVKVPNAQSRLEQMIAEDYSHELIVGLGFIKETRGINGEIYNCFLCGSCSTNYDIVDHILLPKHRLRYLEKLVTEGKHNAVTTISQMEFTDPWFREALVDKECLQMLERYSDMEQVEVYVSKS